MDRPEGDEVPVGAGRARRMLARATTVLAGLFVLVALVAPSDFDAFTPAAFVRLPVEALVGAAIVVLLPGRMRRPVAVSGGVLLGLLTVVKVLDLGFDAVLYRPFDLVFDWPLLGPAVEYLDVTVGRFATVAAAVAAAALVVAAIGLIALSALRLADATARHRTGAIRAVAVLAVAWIACAVPGARLVPTVPVASDSAAVLFYDHAREVRADLHDRADFAAESAVDAFRDTPGQDLLTGLRGKDVVLTFVESYGRDAVEDPELAPQVDAALDAGTERLRAAGFAARSAYLTSPTSGGGSWLAQSTLLSGLWIDNQQRYRTLLASDRLTLTGAFNRAHWRTVGIMPGTTRAWPEGAFFHYDRVYAADDLGYHGPRFSFATMPDQYTLSAFDRVERGTPGHPPLMAVVPLVSSHAPWEPLPHLVGWDEVGDGSVFAGMGGGGDGPDSIFGRDPAQVRADYRQSIEYSLNSLVSWVQNFGDDNLVLVFLGDHQPAQVVTGAGASHDVPITVVARDPAVLDRIAGWNWDDGLRPGPRAPVWPMNAFRDRFLTAFGSQPTTAAPVR